MTRNRFGLLALLAITGLLVAGQTGVAQVVNFTPYKSSGIYGVGEKVGWTVSVATELSANVPEKLGKYTYVIRKNNAEKLTSGEIDLASGSARIETTCDEPAMLYLELTPEKGSGSSSISRRPLAAGAAVAPTKLQPTAPCPSDFDEFWSAQIKRLEAVPANPVLTPGESGNSDIEYSTIKMDIVDGSHAYGQIAKPKKGGKFPALIQFQWASPPYPLEKSWIMGHAKQGWLTLDIEPHDVLPTEPRSYYRALPNSLKHYETVGNSNRDKSYFLNMYLRDFRAVDYIMSRPDWDGKTLVVMGTSMGGQQSICVAGLNPNVTDVIVEEPSGCDTNGPLHGRHTSYPNFPASMPKVMETALYFDAVNFASRVKVPALVSMGFVDNTAAPAGVWTAFNQMKGPKEAAPMIDSPHNNLATNQMQAPYFNASNRWLATLVKGEQVKPQGEDRAIPAADTQPPAASAEPAPLPANFNDYQNMLQQLGVKRVRRGPDPNNKAIFEETHANDIMNTLPDALKMNDGTPVTSADQWPARRAEIVEMFSREVYGRIPDDVPKVLNWEIAKTTKQDIGGIPTITRDIVGHVDNTAYPKIKVDIHASYTIPAMATQPVPVMFTWGFSFAGFGGGRRGAGAATRAFRFPQPPGPPWTQQAIEHGWGYGSIDISSIQPNTFAGRPPSSFTTAGIIGLTNRGQPRKPDQWGLLRAWQWGMSRVIDYFEATPDSGVDPTKIGIEGHSFLGKATLVTEAFEPRIAVAYVSSSGEGGAKLHRHIRGEAVENLAGGEYPWMAGNFIKYGSDDPKMTVADLPVDSHELIALCAPRPCFIGYGGPPEGNWVDAHGSFMAADLASKVYELLGKKGLGTPGDFLTDRMPPIKTLIGGDLAWRQHEFGHVDYPNWPYFFKWVANYISAPPLPATQPAQSDARPAASQEPPVAVQHSIAATPSPRHDPNSMLAHQQLVEKAQKGGIDLYFLGDSIIRRWGCTDPQWAAMMANWKANFYGWNAGNFGWGADSTQNILWRIENGELDGVNPKVIVILCGTNNVGTHPGSDAKIADIIDGIKTIVDVCRQKAPAAKIIVTGIFPRNDSMRVMPEINKINEGIAKLADGQTIRYLNINDKLADENGHQFSGLFIDRLHPTVKGYQIWADALKPILTELLGPPGKTDHAPSATGDPSIANAKPAAH